MFSADVARTTLIGFIGMTIMAARGFQVHAGLDLPGQLWPHLWAPAFLSSSIVWRYFLWPLTERRR